MKRARALLLPALVVVLSACSIPNIMEPNEDAVAEAGSVRAVGVRFVPPEGFEEIDAGDLTKAANSGDAADLAELAESAGMDPQLLVQVLQSVDLYLVGEESTRGYVDNISVADAPGAVPDAKAIRAQFRALGAKVGKVDRVDTDLGKVTTALVTMTVGGVKVQAEAILLDADGTVIITVSSAKRNRTDEIAAQVLETLDED